MNQPLRTAVIAALFMLASALLAWAITPHVLLSTTRGQQSLSSLVPEQFGEWHLDTTVAAGVVNPQQAELLDKLYTQLVTRTYVNAAGQRIMLSIAYGENQRRDSGMQMHFPEVCYPAQGFQIQGNRVSSVRAGPNTIPVRRLETSIGTARYEPVTYWTVIGNVAAATGNERKLAELRYNLFEQKIPDGLLVRVSSISRDTDAAFALQDSFIASMIGALAPAARNWLAGLGA